MFNLPKYGTVGCTCKVCGNKFYVGSAKFVRMSLQERSICPDCLQKTGDKE